MRGEEALQAEEARGVDKPGDETEQRRDAVIFHEPHESRRRMKSRQRRLASEPRRSSCCDVLANTATMPGRLLARLATPRRTESLPGFGSRRGKAAMPTARVEFASRRAPAGGRQARCRAGFMSRSLRHLGKSPRHPCANACLPVRFSPQFGGAAAVFFGELWRKRYIKAMRRAK